MTSQKQIAEELGISVATVSNALTGKGRVSESLTQRIASHAEKVGYIPSPAGRALKTGRSGILGFVMPDITQPLFPKLAQGVEAEADRCGYGVLISDSRGSETGQDQAIRQLVQRGVDGIVIVPQRGTTPHIDTTPVAVINTPTDPANTVSANHIQGGVLAAQKILELGHRDVLLLGGDPQSAVQVDRIAGMEKSLSGRANHTVHWEVDDYPDISQQVGNGTTAVLAVSDLLALRILLDAAQMGIRCPGQLSVVGFDDLPLGTSVRPTLTTIAPDVAEISRRAVAYLLASINGAEPVPAVSSVDMFLIQRQSIGTAPRPQITSLSSHKGDTS